MVGQVKAEFHVFPVIHLHKFLAKLAIKIKGSSSNVHCCEKYILSTLNWYNIHFYVGYPVVPCDNFDRNSIFLPAQFSDRNLHLRF